MHTLEKHTSYGAMENRGVCIKITDDGPGYPTKALETLQQEHTSSEREEQDNAVNTLTYLLKNKRKFLRWAIIIAVIVGGILLSATMAYFIYKDHRMVQRLESESKGPWGAVMEQEAKLTEELTSVWERFTRLDEEQARIAAQEERFAKQLETMTSDLATVGEKVEHVKESTAQGLATLEGRLTQMAQDFNNFKDKVQRFMAQSNGGSTLKAARGEVYMLTTLLTMALWGLLQN